MPDSGRADAHALALEVGRARGSQSPPARPPARSCGRSGPSAASCTGSSNASRPSTASSAVSPERERDVGPAVAQPHQVLDGARAPLRRGAVALEVLGDDLGVGRAVREVDPALATGRHDQPLGLAPARLGGVPAATAARDNGGQDRRGEQLAHGSDRRRRPELRVERVALGDRAPPARRARRAPPRSRAAAPGRSCGRSPGTRRPPTPRVASARVPTRRPLVTIGGRGSNGTALRLTVMPMSCRRSSACWPSSSDSRRSTSTRCTSVPPVRTLTPWPGAAAAPRRRPWRPPTVRCLALAEELGLRRSCSATALPAMTCSSGPPCWPGKTAELIFLAYSSRQMIMPPRAPPSVLWIVVVTTSA